MRGACSRVRRSCARAHKHVRLTQVALDEAAAKKRRIAHTFSVFNLKLSKKFLYNRSVCGRVRRGRDERRKDVFCARPYRRGPQPAPRFLERGAEREHRDERRER